MNSPILTVHIISSFLTPIPLIQTGLLQMAVILFTLSFKSLLLSFVLFNVPVRVTLDVRRMRTAGAWQGTGAIDHQKFHRYHLPLQPYCLGCST